MSKITLTGFALLSLLFLGNSSGNYAAQSKQNTSGALTGTLQKMIVENGSVTMNLDLNRLNGINDLIRKTCHAAFRRRGEFFFHHSGFQRSVARSRAGIDGAGPARPTESPALPAALAASLKQLVIEKLPSDAAFDLAVRDGKTGFTFFNIEGHQYDYDANAQSLSITGGRLLISQEFANALGRPSDAGANRWQDLDRRGDATDRDRPAC